MIDVYSTYLVVLGVLLFCILMVILYHSLRWDVHGFT